MLFQMYNILHWVILIFYSFQYLLKFCMNNHFLVSHAVVKLWPMYLLLLISKLLYLNSKLLLFVLQSSPLCHLWYHLTPSCLVPSKPSWTKAIPLVSTKTFFVSVKLMSYFANYGNDPSFEKTFLFDIFMQ